MCHPNDRVIYHVAPDRAESITLGDLVDLAFETFAEEEEFRARGVLRPLMCDQETFTFLTEGLDSLRSSVLREAFAEVVPFAPQLFINKDVRRTNLVSALAEYMPLDSRHLVRQTSAHLAKVKWRRGADASLPATSHILGYREA